MYFRNDIEPWFCVFHCIEVYVFSKLLVFDVFGDNSDFLVYCREIRCFFDSIERLTIV